MDAQSHTHAGYTPSSAAEWNNEWMLITAIKEQTAKGNNNNKQLN